MITLTSYFLGAFAIGWGIGAGWLFLNDYQRKLYREKHP